MAETLNKQVELKGDTVEVVEQIKTIYNKQMIEERINHIKRQKNRLMETSKTLKEDFDRLVIEEGEFNAYLLQVVPVEVPEVVQELVE